MAASGRSSVARLEGSRVGGYRLDGCLGAGGDTAVYRASTPSGEWCALKLVDVRLQGGDDLARRLRQDAQVIDRIGHPRILPVLTSMAAGHVTAAAMPLVSGPTLRDLMHSGIGSEQAWSILTQIADSLEAAHRGGLTYRVLKPSNILVNDGRAYLSEFGVTGRHSGQVGLATPHSDLPAAQYLAPEQVRGEEPDHRADIYAFAVLVFELATATALFPDEQPSAILARTLAATPPSAYERNPLVPPEVDGVLQRALSKDPRGRHDSIARLLDELACPPPLARTGGRGGDGPGGSGGLSVDSLIDVLSDVMGTVRGDG